MSLGRYLLGSAELLAIAAAIGWGAVRLRRRLLPGWRGVPARLVELVLATSGFVLAIELVGVIQLLRPLPMTLAGVGVGLAMAWFGSPPAPPPRRGERADVDDGPSQMGRVAIWVALGAAFLVAAHWATGAQHSFVVGMYEGDENWYHLPYAARFMQDGSITALHYASPSYLSWFHPLNSELFHAAGMVAYHRDIASPFINLIWLGVALLAAWCIGRPYGVAPITLTAAAIGLDIPIFAGTQAGTAMSDLFGVTFLLAAIALLVNAHGGRSTGEGGLHAPPAVLAIAGLAAGLSLGAKLGFLGPVVVLLLATVVFAATGQRGRTALILALPAVLTSGYWYLRDLWYTGTPYPFVRSIGPIHLPGPDEGLNGGKPFNVAHYLFDGTVWSDWFLPGLRDQVGAIWFLLLAAALVGIALAIIQRRDRVLLAAGLATGIAFVFYLLAPAAAEGPEGMPISFTAGLRVLEPALIPGLALAGVAAMRLSPRGRWIALGVTAVAVLVATNRSAVFWGGFGGLLGAALIAVALVLVPVWLAGRAGRGPAGARGAVLVGCLVLIAAIAAGWSRTGNYLDHRYRSADVPALFSELNIVPLYRWGSDVRDARIGTSGILQYGLYGEDLSNHVQYLGNVGDDQSFREITNCRRWRREVNAGGYDYVVAMPRFGGTRETQAKWTRGPHAREIWHSPPITVFRVTGPLDPGTCGRLPTL